MQKYEWEHIASLLSSKTFLTLVVAFYTIDEFFADTKTVLSYVKWFVRKAVNACAEEKLHRNCVALKISLITFQFKINHNQISQTSHNNQNNCS